MIADVVDLPVAKQDDRQLEIPGWVPVAVASYARTVLAEDLADPNRGPILRRLLLDPRMRTVWSELMRKRRRDGRFLRPAQIPAISPAAAQDSAMLLFFILAHQYAMHNERPLLQREVDAIRAERVELARKLREQAEVLSFEEEALSLRRRLRSEKLDAAADILEELAAKTGEGNVVVERERGDLDAHGLAVTIANTCRWLFGSSLFTVSATITSVALGAEVTPRRAREWLRCPPMSPTDG
jgi:hypothetical protein